MFSGSRPVTERLHLGSEVERLVVLGDPHGELAGVEAVLAREEGPGVRVLCVGDVVGKAAAGPCSALVELLRDRGVVSVQGNHEEWVGDDGRMAIVPPGEPDAVLDEAARAWCAALPAVLEVFHQAAGRRVAVMTHALREPRWRDVSTGNARSLAERFGGPDLLLVGHSHRPRFLEVPRRGEVEGRAFRFDREEVAGTGIPDGGTLVVDAGSVGDPELESGEQGTGWGTYAVVDLAGRRAELRRVQLTR